MAKSKNHTSHHQNRKDHRNGIKRPKKIPIRSFEGQDRTFLFNLRKSRRNNQTAKQLRHLNSSNIIKTRIFIDLVKEEVARVKKSANRLQASLRKRSVARSHAKLYLRKLNGERVRAQLIARKKILAKK